MYLKEAIKIQNKAINNLRQIYRFARSCGYNQNWIHREECGIFASLPKNFSMMRRDHLRIACRVLLEEMFERDLEGVYLYKGETYSVNKTSKNHKVCKHIDPKELHDKNEGFAFFWIETGKMYSCKWTLLDRGDNINVQ